MQLISSSESGVEPILHALTPSGVAGVISLFDPGSGFPSSIVDAVPEGRHLRLPVRDIEMSDDVWTVRWGGDSGELFSEQHAAQLVDFVHHLRSMPRDDAHLLVHCGQGRSRSTAATLLVAAASGLAPLDAVRASFDAHTRSFVWDETRPWIPNMRMITLGSKVIHGDHRLVAARWSTALESES